MEQNGGQERQKYYFHCENELLKYNQDYQSLLRTLALLEAQKIQAIKDLELLEELKAQTQTDPDEVLRKLKEGTLTLPTRQTIVSIPEINWDKYGGNNPLTAGSYNMRKNKKLETESPSCSSSQNKSTNNNGDNNKKGKQNRCPWTEEEQAKLEELLKLHPPEEIEAKRWEKIAYHLPNRTPKQVCCRVQKYFIKLAKAGLPVPGRVPNLAAYTRKGRLKRARRKIPKQSIFLNSYKPRVYMDNKDIEEGDLSSDDDGSSDSAPTSPVGVVTNSITCSSCQISSLCVYWECTECEGIMLCQNCVNSQWSNDDHCSSHEMTQVHTAQEKEALQYIDRDYTGFNPSSSSTNYNYLDANFHPAV